LKGRFGPTFAGDPHLPKALRRNGAGAGFLDADESKAAWDRGEYARVAASLARKVAGINTLYERARAGTFLTAEAIEIIPGGFAYRGRPYDLVGRPRDMLEALLNARYRRATADDLRKAMGIDDETVNDPEQVVRDTAKILRHALRKAVQDAGVDCQDPLRSMGKGEDLTYSLEFP
jgi:hypothetical protein